MLTDRSRTTTKNQKSYQADCIVIGAGIFGLYAAYLLASKGNKVLLLEKGLEPFSRASAINQARIHNGYHYPRSYETTERVASYYDRFTRDFGFAINSSFQQIYAITHQDSKTSVEEFVSFCKAVNIPLEAIDSEAYFKSGMVSAAFLADESSFDFAKVKDHLLDKGKDGTRVLYDAHIESIDTNGQNYVMTLQSGLRCSAPLVINATYAGLNEVIEKFGHDTFDLKYELCEVAFCKVNKNLSHIGITVMDGPYFSIMPFGDTELHSLTAVEHTPHFVTDSISLLDPDNLSQLVCSMHKYKNCSICSRKIVSNWGKMNELAESFMQPGFKLDYKYSQFEFKAILKDSEDDDSRPTIIKHHTNGPTFISVFSGKISTIYELEKYL